MQGYFAANDEVAWRIAAWGVAPERTFITKASFTGMTR
jgi:hypothetical protein